jgi:hypothetical protein
MDNQTVLRLESPSALKESPGFTKEPPIFAKDSPEFFKDSPAFTKESRAFLGDSPHQTAKDSQVGFVRAENLQFSHVSLCDAWKSFFCLMIAVDFCLPQFRLVRMLRI